MRIPSTARRIATWAGLVLAGCVVLFVAAALLLPALVNLERYRSMVAQRISRAVGREVTIGALHLNLWRGFGAEVNGIQIAQAPGFGPDPFVTAEGVRVRVQVLPLLTGQVKIASAVLQRPRIRLVHAADGRWSFEGLLKPSAPPPSPRAPAEAPRPGKASFLTGLALNQVVVRNGEITVLEAGSAAAPLTLHNVDCTIRQVAPTDPIGTDIRADLQGAATGTLEGAARLALGETLDVNATLRLKNLDVKDWGAIFPAWKGTLVTGPMSVEVQASGPLGRPEVRGALDFTPATIRVGGAFQKVAGEKAQVTFRGRRLDPGLRLDAWAIDLRDQHLEGTLTVPDLGNPRLTFTATAAKLNVDRLLTAPQKKVGSMSGIAWAAPVPAASTVPGALSARGQVAIEALSVHGITLNGATGEIRYQAGVLQVPDFQARLQAGALRAQVEVDLRGKVPRMRLTSNLEHFPTEPLLQALGFGPWKLKSDLVSSSQVEFDGWTVGALLGSLNGTGQIQLRDGRVTNYLPLERLTEAVGPLLAAQGVRMRLNEFDQASGHYSVANGILRTNDFTVVKPEGTITAAGALGLLDSSLNFDVTMKLARATIEAKVMGTASHPIIIPKAGRFEQRIEQQLNKAFPEGKRQNLQEMLKNFFGR